MTSLSRPISYIQAPTDLLSRLHNGNTDIPTAYFHPSKIVRWLFSHRLKHSIQYTRFLKRRDICLDVGCGGGALLPTLSHGFNEVIGLDKDIGPAAQIKAMLSLRNVEVVEGDLYETSIPHGSLDCIFAISVIEHLEDTDSAIRRFSHWLAPDGLLVISVPSENCLYQAGRWMFNFTRPHTHHDLKPLIPLLRQYFTKTFHKSWPLPIPAFAYFHIYVGQNG